MLILHQEPLWRIKVLRKGRKICVFDRAALRREVLRGVGALVRAKRSDPKKVTIPHFACWCLEDKLADARRDAPVDEADPEFLTVNWDTASTSGE